MKLFTVTEARTLLPEVRRLLLEAQTAREAIKIKSPEMAETLEAAAGNGHSPVVNDLAAEYRRLEKAVKAILALGVQIKDLETGLLDFPCIHEGREVLLCWQSGEEDIRWWHEVEDGFAGRQPLWE